MRASLLLTRAVAGVCAVSLGLASGCANKRHAPAQAISSATALPDLPEPPGVLGELRLAHPDATFRAVRELGRPLSSLLPAGFPMFAVSLLGLPPLSADSFDPELPALGLLMKSANGDPGWVFALHVVSGPELVAKLCTGDHAPFRAAASAVAGLKLIEPSVVASPSPATRAFSLAVFDNYLVVASNAELAQSAGPFAARTLPRRSTTQASIAFRFSKRALESDVVPALRALWAGYRTHLAHLDQASRSAHGGHAPDFADPATVILGADAVVESLLSLVDGAAALELDLDPSPNRLDAMLVLEPEPGSEVQSKLATLAVGNAQGLLTLPSETEFVLGLSRSDDERETAGKAAGDDWVRLLGSRLTERDSKELRAVLTDWELGRGTQTRYGFLGGADPGAFLVTDVADAARLKRAGSGFFGLLALPGLRAPMAEFLGQPSVADAPPPADALANVSRKKLTLSPTSGRKGVTTALSFAWLVQEKIGFAAASKNGDGTLKVVVESAGGAHEALGAQAGLADSVQRVGDQAALYAYADARLLFRAEGSAATVPAPLLLSLGKHGSSAALRLEISQLAVALAVRGMIGQ